MKLEDIFYQFNATDFIKIEICPKFTQLSIQLIDYETRKTIDYYYDRKIHTKTFIDHHLIKNHCLEHIFTEGYLFEDANIIFKNIYKEK